MIATVQITESGGVVACLDTDDFAADEEDRALSGLVADSLLDQCARVAIETFLQLRQRVEDDGDGE
ncbi:hypothetical protein [Nocardioides terrigena]|jgi:hypothetical protein|uniref:hypothetical protein n=1 Tax=Nocardioides terrigena TaxID=424797 RepID=UPI000D30C8FA|nr:hypothetical protein [Nocardioides terrigena]